MMPNPNVPKSPMVLFDVQNDIAGNQDGSIPPNLKTPADYYREMFSPGVVEAEVEAPTEAEAVIEPVIEPEVAAPAGKNNISK